MPKTPRKNSATAEAMRETTENREDENEEAEAADDSDRSLPAQPMESSHSSSSDDESPQRNDDTTSALGRINTKRRRNLNISASSAHRRTLKINNLTLARALTRTKELLKQAQENLIELQGQNAELTQKVNRLEASGASLDRFEEEVEKRAKQLNQERLLEITAAIDTCADDLARCRRIAATDVESSSSVSSVTSSSTNGLTSGAGTRNSALLRRPRSFCLSRDNASVTANDQQKPTCSGIQQQTPRNASGELRAKRSTTASTTGGVETDLELNTFSAPILFSNEERRVKDPRINLDTLEELSEGSPDIPRNDCTQLGRSGSAHNSTITTSTALARSKRRSSMLFGINNEQSPVPSPSPAEKKSPTEPKMRPSLSHGTNSVEVKPSTSNTGKNLRRLTFVVNPTDSAAQSQDALRPTVIDSSVSSPTKKTESFVSPQRLCTATPPEADDITEEGVSLKKKNSDENKEVGETKTNNSLAADVAMGCGGIAVNENEEPGSAVGGNSAEAESVVDDSLAAVASVSSAEQTFTKVPAPSLAAESDGDETTVLFPKRSSSHKAVISSDEDDGDKGEQQKLPSPAKRLKKTEHGVPGCLFSTVLSPTNVPANGRRKQPVISSDDDTPRSNQKRVIRKKPTKSKVKSKPKPPADVYDIFNSDDSLVALRENKRRSTATEKRSTLTEFDRSRSADASAASVVDDIDGDRRPKRSASLRVTNFAEPKLTGKLRQGDKFFK